MTQGAAGSAEVHLKRAWGLIDGVSKATEELRQRVQQHEATLDQVESASGVGGFLGGMVAGMRSAGQLRREKSSLVNDLQLASEELDRAAKLQPDAAIEIDKGTLGIPHMRAVILNLKGQVEMIWGTSQKAKDYFNQSLQIVEHSDPHYMLGLLYESDYNPQEALVHFEKCLELDPDGELSVCALREANAMRNYKKRFRGSWGTFGCLFLLFFPAAILYFILKRK